MCRCFARTNLLVKLFDQRRTTNQPISMYQLNIMTDTYEKTLSRRCENVLMCQCGRLSLCLRVSFCSFSSAPNPSLLPKIPGIHHTHPHTTTHGLLMPLTRPKISDFPVIPPDPCQSTDLSTLFCLPHLRTNLEVNLLKMPEAAGRLCWLLPWEREGEAGAPWYGEPCWSRAPLCWPRWKVLRVGTPLGKLVRSVPAALLILWADGEAPGALWGGSL